MLQITASTKVLKEELFRARGFCKTIITVLETVTADTNLTEKVGSYISNLSNYRVLGKDADSAKKLLRMVCSGELNTVYAAEKFKTALIEIEKLQHTLKDFS